MNSDVEKKLENFNAKIGGEKIKEEEKRKEQGIHKEMYDEQRQKDFGTKIEDEKKKLEEEEKREERKKREKILAEQKEKEKKSYVENKIKKFTGIDEFRLTQEEVKNNLQVLYNSFKLIDSVYKEKMERNINFQAVKVKINDEEIFFDEDIVLEAKIRAPFVKKIKEILSNYEQKVIPKIVDIGTFNKYYFVEIDKIIMSLCELYYNFLLEFDIDDNDFKNICTKYSNKWIKRHYSFLKPLYGNIENVLYEAGVKVDKKYEYNNKYEPIVYNGPGVLNAIDAKFQSEMVGVGVNFIRMMGNNLEKLMAINKVKRVINDAFKEINVSVQNTGRFICSWGEELINDAIVLMKQRNVIEISTIPKWSFSKIADFISDLSKESNTRYNSYHQNITLNKIYCLNPFCIDGTDGASFLSYYEVLECFNIDHIFIVEYNIKAKSELAIYRDIAKRKLNSGICQGIDELQNILTTYKLVEKLEYNNQIKNKIREFNIEFNLLIQEILKNKEDKEKQEREETKDLVGPLYNLYREDVNPELTKKTIDDAIKSGKIDFVWNKIEEGVVYAEYAMLRYYDKICKHAMDTQNLDEFEECLSEVKCNMKSSKKLVAVASQYIFYYESYKINGKMKHKYEADICAMKILNMAKMGNISAIAMKGFWGTQRDHNATNTVKEGIKYLEIAAKKQEPIAMAWLGSYYRTGDVIGKKDKDSAKYYLERAAFYGCICGITELKKLNNPSSSSSSGSCFITTATCISLGKGDDCKELTDFRSFRDKWLIYQPDGKQLIEEYYVNAPKIVENIDRTSNSSEIYKKIWKIYLKRCMEYIECKDYYACKNLYIKMVKTLMVKFG